MHTTTTTGTHLHAHPGTPPHHQHLEHAVVDSSHGPRHGRVIRRLLAGAAALALAVTGALAAAPGTAHADAHRDGQWYLDDFNIDKVHELSQGEGVKIGVIDSGIDPDHPDLKSNITKGAQLGPDGKIDGNAHTDDVGHGTAVASVLAGHGHGTNSQDGILGIAPKAKIIPAKVEHEELSWEDGSDSYAEALQYLVDQDVNIISMSITTGSTAESSSALEQARNKGITIVASAGNYHSTDIVGNDQKTRDTGWPARNSGVIPVAGTNQNHESWDGSAYLKQASLQPQLGLSAPAAEIPVAQPGNKYSIQEGTSFATPIVAGTLALIKSAYPDLDLYTQQDRLLETVDDKGKEGFDDKYGWGIVNPYKALTDETTFTDADGNKTVSSPDDRLPLEKQGDPVSNVPPPDAVPTPDNTPDLGDKHKNKDEAATETPGPPTWVTITIITAGALLTAALITLVIIKTRRGKKNPPPPATGPPPHGHPGQPGQTPPLGPPPSGPGNSATQQTPSGPTPPPQHNPGQAPPNAYGAPTAPGALPPQAAPHQPGQANSPQASLPQPGQPDSAPPPPPAGDSPWQPHDPNPPPHQPPQ